MMDEIKVVRTELVDRLTVVFSGVDDGCFLIIPIKKDSETATYCAL